MLKKARKPSDQQATSHSDHHDLSSSVQSDDQFIVVPTRKKSSKDYDSKKPTLDARILLEQLIQVSDLMPQLKDLDVLNSPNYFGKYGEIVSSKVYEKQVQGKKKKNYVAYITYKNDLDVALALVAMQNFSHSFYKCSCKYGTSRYCEHFLKDDQCNFKNCLYLHEVRKKSLYLHERSSLSVTQSIKQAKEKIVDNLSYFVEKQYQEYLENKKGLSQNSKIKCTCPWINKSQMNKVIEFPSITSTLALLIKNGDIEEEVYNNIKKSIKHKKQVKKDPIITEFAELETSFQDFILQLNQFPILDVQKPKKVQALQTPVPLPPKIKAIHQNQPYIFKRYLYPHIKVTQLSPQSKLIEKYCQEREIELAARKYYRPKKVQMSKKSLHSHKAFNKYLHTKIMHTLKHKDLSKSQFDFANPQTMEPSKQLQNQILNILLRQ